MKIFLLYTTNYIASEAEIRLAGGRITQIFTRNLFEAYFESDINPAVLTRSSLARADAADADSRSFIETWTAPASDLSARTTPVEPRRSWGADGDYPRNTTNDPDLRTHMQSLLQTRIMPPNTSKLMTGKICFGLTIVKNPNIQSLDFSLTEINNIKAETNRALQFLSYSAPKFAKLQFSHVWNVVDIAASPATTIPVNAPPNVVYEHFENIFRDPALAKLGYPVGRPGLAAYIDDLKDRNQSDWAFISFITRYTLAHFAYNYGGSSFLLYDQVLQQGGLANILAHESCHAFGAADEYRPLTLGKPLCTCAPSGTYAVKNYNCVDCKSTYPKVECLMEGHALTLCRWSKGQLGWWLSPAGKTSAVAYQSDQLHVFYRDLRGSLYDVTFRPKWACTNLHDANRSAPLAQGDPCSLVYGKQIHVFYRDKDNQISDMYFDGNSWTFREITNASFAKPADGDPCTVVSPETINVFYRDLTSHIAHISFRWGAWYSGDLHDKVKNAPNAQGDPFAIIYAGMQIHVLYRDVNNHISDIYFTGLEWVYQDLHNGVKSAPNAQSNPVSVIYFDQMHVLYRDANNHISDIYFDGKKWIYQDLNKMTGSAPNTASDPCSIVYLGQQHHTLYQDINNQISDIYFDGQRWIYQNLTKGLPDATPAKGGPSSAIFAQTQMHVFYPDDNSSLSNLRYQNKWESDDISNAILS